MLKKTKRNELIVFWIYSNRHTSRMKSVRS